MVKMADLKAEFERLALENVQTYINSGNVAFDTGRASEAKLSEKIESALERHLGRRIDVMVRKQKDIRQIIDSNPFVGQYESHKNMHVLFLKEPMPKEKKELLQSAALPGEKYEVRGLEIYNLLPKGVAGSLLTKGFFEKKPRVAYTGRNWRTVEKLAEL